MTTTPDLTAAPELPQSQLTKDTVEAQQIIAACRRVYCKEVLGWKAARASLGVKKEGA